MTRLLVSASPGEVQVAAVSGGELVGFALWRPGRPDGVGDVYRARVSAAVPAMAGSFVALPGGGDGFLPDSEGAAGLGEGAAVTVRVVRAGQGGKGPRLAGAAAEAGPPGLVRPGPTPLDDMMAAHAGAEVVADDPAWAPPGATIVARAFDPAVADAVAALAAREVALPGGMVASIDPTPALVAIDLDMAAGAGERAAKAGAQMAANLRALPAVARQIRLRNLSGAILIDPAGLAAKRRAKLGPALLAALAADPLAPRLLGWTALGLAEIVRRRVRPPLHELLAGPHAAGLRGLRAMAREAAAAPHVAFGLACGADVLAALTADAVALADLARRTGRPPSLRAEAALGSGAWRIERTN